MKKIVAFAVCFLLHLTRVHGDEASSSSSSSSDTAPQSAAASSSDELSRAKRAVDMRRLARGIQMLRLGKRSQPWMTPSGPAYPEDDLLLQHLLAYLNNQYYDQDYPLIVEEPGLHPRYRRSVENNAHDSQDEASTDVKRSVGYLDGPGAEDDFVDEEGYLGDSEVVKRPMSMLRLGKRPMSMLRLGKRPVSMLRLGKRPMSMLRLGKREGDEEEGLLEPEDVFYPAMDGEELSADKRPVSMLRLGKRPMSMLRLGKRPMSMLRLGKRPMSMLRLGKRPMSMLRLGKRQVPMLRLGKRQVPMLRLGKRQVPMLRLGKRSAE